jgi:hypothetical protein
MQARTRIHLIIRKRLSEHLLGVGTGRWQAIEKRFKKGPLSRP